MFMLCICNGIFATRYYVYQIKGDVRLSKGSSRELLKKKDVLTDKSLIVIPAGGSLVLLDVDHKAKVTISKQGTKTVQQYLTMKSTLNEIAKPKYWLMLLSQLVKGDEEESGMGTHHGVIDREVSLADTLSQQVDSIAADSINAKR